MKRAAFLLLVLAILGYEAWAILDSVPGDTISENVWAWSDSFGPIVGFVAGVIGGHFFWPRRTG